MNSLKLKIKEMPYLILKVFGLIFIAFVLESCGGVSSSYYDTEPCMVYGKVTDADTQEPIEGIKVHSWQSYEGYKYTDSLGNYNIFAGQGKPEISYSDINGVWLDTIISPNTLNMSKVKLDVALKKAR
jgi:hypothetical protein